MKHIEMDIPDMLEGDARMYNTTTDEIITSVPVLVPEQELVSLMRRLIGRY